MERRHLLKYSLALVGCTFLTQVSYAKGNAIKLSNEGINPFRINFGKDKIKDLHRRLDNMIWPEMPFDTGWSTGTNDKILKDLVKFWRYEYNWFKEQDKLNQLSHFQIPIEGEQMHFVQYKGSGVRQKFPLLLLHGWPSSFLEFTDAASILVNGINGQLGFDLIVPSLPGFAFSDAPKQAGIHPGKMAERMQLLMQKLGYSHYVVVGGDWGYGVGSRMANMFPESINGFYTHIGGRPELPIKRTLTIEEKNWVDRFELHTKEGTAYGQLQRTKPQTLAYSLQDSPVGILAWILEKYWAWSDHGDDLWQTFKKEDILTTATMYWLTGHILSASRIYYENEQSPKVMPIKVPTGYANYPKEPWATIHSLLDINIFPNVIHWSDMPKGGHFPAKEVPDLWATDVASFVSKIQ